MTQRLQNDGSQVISDADLPVPTLPYSGREPGHIADTRASDLEYPWRDDEDRPAAGDYLIEIFDLAALPDRDSIRAYLAQLGEEDGAEINLHYGSSAEDGFTFTLVALDPVAKAEPLGQVNARMRLGLFSDAEESKPAITAFFEVSMIYVPKKHRRRYIGSTLAWSVSDTFTTNLSVLFDLPQAQVLEIDVLVYADWDSEGGRILSERIAEEVECACDLYREGHPLAKISFSAEMGY